MQKWRESEVLDRLLAGQARVGGVRRDEDARTHEQSGFDTPSLEALLQLVASDLRDAEAILFTKAQSKVELIPELAGYLISNGGKRIRMALLLACARLIGYSGPRSPSLAAALEFIHTATLLHDDVVDRSALRRGQPTANTIWGNRRAVVVGDFLLGRAFEMLVDDGSLDVVNAISRASMVLSAGEVSQLASHRQIETTEETYFRIISAKTAALFEVSCQIAGYLPGGNKATAVKFKRFGRSLGIAFQLTDDVIDYVSTSARMGKHAGDDFRDGKVTLPVIIAFARGSPADRRFWEDAMQGNKVSDTDFAHALKLLEDTGAIRDTLARAYNHGRVAKSHLSSFGNSRAKSALSMAVDFAVSRCF